MPRRQRRLDREGEDPPVTNNWLFVGAAFGVTWAVFIGYFVHLQRTTRRARALLEMNANPGAR